MFESSLLTFLTVGFLLGLRHALDADHLAAVSTVLAERPSMRASGLVGLWWGVGHTLTLMMVGAVVLVSGIHIPEPFALLAESGVGLLLVVLGGTLALKLFRERWHLHSHVHDGEPHVHLHSHRRREDHAHPHWARQSLRPLLIGMAHGVAGSAALMLVIVSNTSGIGQGLLYIAVFGLGSIGGMLMIGLTLSVPVIYSRAIGQRAFFAVQGAASLGSVGLGLWMLYRLVLSPDGL
ncbi:MAG: sulfite exporter TauE/SafE family protein [Nitrospira sp.]|nr:sulfite exporter TauE/SafE family protein [Nitrospira sp.]